MVATTKGLIQKALFLVVHVYCQRKCSECVLKHVCNNIPPALGWFAWADATAASQPSLQGEAGRKGEVTLQGIGTQ